MTNERLEELVAAIIDEFRLNATIYLGGLSHDEMWMMLFRHKYPVEYQAFLELVNKEKRQ